MAAAVTAKRRLEINTATLQRAQELCELGQIPLTATAVNCLARSAAEEYNDRAITMLGSLADAEQAPVCWSLLLSGRERAVQTVADFFTSHPHLGRQMDIESLLELSAEAPPRYQPIFEMLAPWCRQFTQRMRLLHLQAPLMNERWAKEVEHSCQSGPLNHDVAAVVEDILLAHSEASYPLVKQLFKQHDQLTLANLSACNYPLGLARTRIWQPRLH